MANEDGTLQIVFNGEIYNHARDPAELERHRRTPLADRPLRHRGDPARLRGMGHRLPATASAACSRSRSGTRAARDLWLVRDRIGDQAALLRRPPRPAGLRLRDQGAARRTREQPRAVDEEALYHYLSFLTTPAPQTLFDGIRKLAGGHAGCVSTRDGAVRERALLGRLGPRRRR